MTYFSFRLYCIILVLSQDILCSVRRKILRRKDIIPYQEPESNDFDGNGHNTIMKFTYDDADKTLGPTKWSILQDADETVNECETNWKMPGNIVSNHAVAQEVAQESDEDMFKSHHSRPSLILNIPNKIPAHVEWEFSYPTDTYNGIEIRPPYTGVLQLLDKFDPPKPSPGVFSDKNTAYDFSYASIFYCDPLKANKDRSMFKIDGKRFPLEIDLVFFANAPKVGSKKSNVNNQVIILTIMGDFSVDDRDNPRLEPMLKAAKKFKGGPFINSTDTMALKDIMRIRGPFSVSWFIPEVTDYYYIDGTNFPVPPCWTATRTYILRDAISISHKQLNILTNIKSQREPGKVLSCTYSVSKSNDLTDDGIEIRLNSNPILIRGDDQRPTLVDTII